MQQPFFLYHHTLPTKTPFLTFIPENHPHHLPLLYSHPHYPKTILLHIQTNKFPIIPPHDLNQPPYLHHAFSITQQIPEELPSFLFQLI
ncbi:SAV0927 family protein [Bacillus thuringiensis]|uniref:SAV0927 family protein n=1 Tax=Bacillus thuringiensis TaxID=1428 RepID=UPI0011A91653|nr:SAV0927 family protein [Bacillus thuringiensis]